MADLAEIKLVQAGSNQPPKRKNPRAGFYDEVDGLSPSLLYFTESNLYEVESLAGSLTFQEVLDYFGYDLEEITRDSITYGTLDLHWFHRAFKRGRTKAKMLASDRLFNAMSSRQGKEACIAYLRSFATNFAESGENDGNSPGKFNFTVSLDE